MKIRDLEQWPPSVWATTGSTRLIPNLASAIIKSVRTNGEAVSLRVDDQNKEYVTALVFIYDHSARGVALTLKDAIGKTIQDAGELVVKKVRSIRVKK
ncbi:MAG: hypothetical protein LUQ65_13380 [Candidatus Helarchaeota archaeon]|nr:hypothetical protein [Candidatus Helarchaeota archaeon]